jgi:chloramphenicol 3-O-phosphotransferase
MTLVDDAYFSEVIGGIRAEGVRLAHVTLVAPAEVITERLSSRSGAEKWAKGQVERCVAALADARFAEHLNAVSATPKELAAQIERLVAGSA